MTPEELGIVHNQDENRFEIQLDDGLAMVEYMQPGKNIIFTHTEVPPAYEGQGIASRLAKHALDYARAEGFKVQPLCPYIKGYILRHPEYKDITWGM